MAIRVPDNKWRRLDPWVLELCGVAREGRGGVGGGKGETEMMYGGERGNKMMYWGGKEGRQ